VATRAPTGSLMLINSMWCTTRSQARCGGFRFFFPNSVELHNKGNPSLSMTLASIAPLDGVASVSSSPTQLSSTTKGFLLRQWP
jgi:hypothetical protein